MKLKKRKKRGRKRKAVRLTWGTRLLRFHSTTTRTQNTAWQSFVRRQPPPPLPEEEEEETREDAKGEMRTQRWFLGTHLTLRNAVAPERAAGTVAAADVNPLPDHLTH